MMLEWCSICQAYEGPHGHKEVATAYGPVGPIGSPGSPWPPGVSCPPIEGVTLSNVDKIMAVLHGLPRESQLQLLDLAKERCLTPIPDDLMKNMVKAFQNLVDAPEPKPITFREFL